MSKPTNGSDSSGSNSNNEPANTNTGTVKGNGDAKKDNSGDNKKQGREEGNNTIGGTAKMEYNTAGDLLNEGARVIREQKALREAEKKDPNYRSTTDKVTKGISNRFGRFKDWFRN